MTRRGCSPVAEVDDVGQWRPIRIGSGEVHGGREWRPSGAGRDGGNQGNRSRVNRDRRGRSRPGVGDTKCIDDINRRRHHCWSCRQIPGELSGGPGSTFSRAVQSGTAARRKTCTDLRDREGVGERRVRGKHDVCQTRQGRPRGRGSELAGRAARHLALVGDSGTSGIVGGHDLDRVAAVGDHAAPAVGAVPGGIDIASRLGDIVEEGRDHRVRAVEHGRGHVGRHGQVGACRGRGVGETVTGREEVGVGRVLRGELGPVVDRDRRWVGVGPVVRDPERVGDVDGVAEGGRAIGAVGGVGAGLPGAVRARVGRVAEAADRDLRDREGVGERRVRGEHEPGGPRQGRPAVGAVSWPGVPLATWRW